jgi:K+ transporter
MLNTLLLLGVVAALVTRAHQDNLEVAVALAVTDVLLLENLLVEAHLLKQDCLCLPEHTQ